MIDLQTRFGRTARKHLNNEYFVWLTTIDSTGTPQPRPVWFIWENGTVLIYSQAKAHKVVHIRKNPQVSLHFNTADVEGESRIVILTGTAAIDDHGPRADQHRAYMKKYKSGIARLGATPAQFSGEYSIAIRITPTNLRGSE